MSTVAPRNEVRTVKASRPWRKSGNARRRFPVTIHRAGDYEFPDGLTLRSRRAVTDTVRTLTR